MQKMMQMKYGKWKNWVGKKGDEWEEKGKGWGGVRKCTYRKMKNNWERWMLKGRGRLSMERVQKDEDGKWDKE